MAPKTPVMHAPSPENIVVESAVSVTSRRADGGPEENHDAQKRLIRDIALANPEVLVDASKNFGNIYKTTGRDYTGPYAADEAQPHPKKAMDLIDATVAEVHKMGDEARIKTALADLTAAAKENIALSGKSGWDANEDKRNEDLRTVQLMAAAKPKLAAEASDQLKKDGNKEAAALIDKAILESGQKLKQANMGSAKHADASGLQTPNVQKAQATQGAQLS